MWNRRLTEWTLVTLVLVALIWVFGRQVRAVQSQSERAAVQSTVGVLRTALVVDYVTQQARGAANRVAPLNPFLLLKTVPTNFAGVGSMANADAMVLGAWVFDAECACIGYRLLYPEALDAPEGAQAVWFRIGGPAGALQIQPLTRYVWQGQVLN